ncbi:hypothetical protein D917_10169, partial [Trichinella nativa]
AGWSTWTDVLQFVCRRCNKVRTAVEIVHAFAALLCRNLKKLEQPEFARSGNKATETITIPAGPLEQFQFTIEPLLRKLGLPVTLEKGVVIMEKDFVVCRKDCVLTPEQAKILELFGIKLAKF